MEVAPASVGQWTEGLRCKFNVKMEETQLELHTSLHMLAWDLREEAWVRNIAKINEARAAQGVVSTTRTGTGRVETPKSDGSISWTVFRHQFEAVAGQYKWTPTVKPSVCFLSWRSGLPLSSTESLKKRRTRRSSKPLKTVLGTKTWP
jgi:hypothetical protein